MTLLDRAAPLPTPSPRQVSTPTPTPTAPDVPRGFAYGLLGVTIFALTLPMTRLAVGDAADPQLAPAFVTAGRAAVAGVLGACWLLARRAAAPPRALWPALAVSAAGTVVGFPLGIALALRSVDAMHAAVVTGVLPLATAAVAALALRQRPSAAFWACAVAGAALVMAFAAWQGSGRLQAGDAWLLVAMLSAAAGYVGGARAGARLPASDVISWVLVASLPLTLPAALWWWPTAPVRASAWAGFAYASVFSMWLGFFAWYRGLALGGVMRVSQVQLLQPFLALLAAVPILGERLDAATVVFSLAVVAVVAVGRRLSVGRPAPPSPPLPAPVSATRSPRP